YVIITTTLFTSNVLQINFFFAKIIKIYLFYNTLDFSMQSEFNEIATVFALEKNGSPARIGDYAVNNGIITFKKAETIR
ncbi:MAG: hypothetical protein FWH36_06820, partial [Lentimicrobiaceae bacterium]|nr:hypothetical protein [Lentimicrobiaceae bacterium]